MLQEFLRDMSALRAAAFPDPTLRYRGTEDLLLHYGHSFGSVHLNEMESAVVEAILEDFDTPPQHCFLNAQKLAHAHPDLFTYCEGYGVWPIPIYHAWVAHHGKVVDPTWTFDTPTDENREFRPHCVIGVIPPGVEYFGIELRDRDWPRWWESHGNKAGPVLEDWHRGWDLFTGRLTPETLVPVRSRA